MTDAQKAFLQIAGDFLAQTTSNISNAYKGSLIEQYGECHSLLPIIYYQCKSLVPECQQQYVSQISRYVKIRNEVEKIEELFCDFPYALEKGIVLAEFYPIPALRTMGDVDILVSESDISKAKNILNSNGFKCEVGESDELKFTKQGILFEIHSRPMHAFPGNERFVEYFSDWMSKVDNHRLEKNYHALYVFVHLRQHLLGSGVGFRQFMDIAIITQKWDLNWQWINRQAEVLGINKFIEMVLAFNEKWFCIKSPFKIEIDDNFFNVATEAIFNNGVFGQNNIDNKLNPIPRLAVNKGISIKKAKYFYYLTHVFPSYNRFLKFTDCPSYLIDRKWLLPVAWAHRMMQKCLGKSFIAGVNKHKTNTRDFSSSNERMEYFRRWGLS